MRMQSPYPGGGSSHGGSAHRKLEPRSDIRGRHRTQAELDFLTHEIEILKEELKRLETMEYSSVACKELVMRLENAPDPLISRESVSANPGPSLNRWFEQPATTNNCCWMF
ncbi:hypothetical protein KP509_12G026400 [Ceratopteris richardii]|uniref:G protein gamma domain-containing protein n=1 Tax=Ceratopteris richardii TaxID=49495 RepID=A0A8T2TJI6_CERRI|nr:hypothetical protein KP509_12G026400 [Ceratopteris richardii]